jgi:hypothetical protein
MRTTGEQMTHQRDLPGFVSRLALLGIGWAVVAGLLGPGCREQPAPPDTDQPPETVITGAPADSEPAFYRIRLYWGGFDPDGDVVGFEWAITESIPDPSLIDYHYTTRTDSIFRFRVEENHEVVGRRFYVRAIDDDGKRDPTPAFTFLSARNTCAPEVRFLCAEAVGPGGGKMPITSTNRSTPTDTVPSGWSVDFAWSGFDCDVALRPDGSVDTVGSVDHYLYHLSPLELNEIGGTIADTAASYPAAVLTSRVYTLLVRAVDDAGFAGLDPAVRSFVWNRDPQTWWTRRAIPGNPAPVSVFFADTLGTAQDLEDYDPFTSGDTLPARSGGIRIWSKVESFDPDDPTGSGQNVAWQARVIQDTGFWQGLTTDRIFRSSQPLNQGHSLGPWILMCRAKDAFGRWDGTPDTLLFYINKSPRFVTEWEEGGETVEQIPQPDQVIEIAPENLGGRDRPAERPALPSRGVHALRPRPGVAPEQRAARPAAGPPDGDLPDRRGLRGDPAALRRQRRVARRRSAKRVPWQLERPAIRSPRSSRGASIRDGREWGGMPRATT